MGKSTTTTGTWVYLTDHELAALNGLCRDEVQTKVDASIARIEAREKYQNLPERLFALIFDAVREAKTNGLLVYTKVSLRRCRLCGKQGGYYRFKSGPRKGMEDPTRPLFFDGIELAHRFVFIQGHVSVGGCVDCINTALPHLREALRGVYAQVPDELRADGEPKRLRHNRRKCNECGWEGHEGQMGRLPTLSGIGTYPGKCPECGHEKPPLALKAGFDRLPGFVVVEEPESSERGR